VEISSSHYTSKVLSAKVRETHAGGFDEPAGIGEKPEETSTPLVVNLQLATMLDGMSTLGIDQRTLCEKGQLGTNGNHPGRSDAIQAKPRRNTRPLSSGRKRLNSRDAKLSQELRLNS
jgi:hypothetical protein